jgi:beta-lactam-binding protein with PASTA domain
LTSVAVGHKLDVTQPPPPPDDRWPTSDEPTVVSRTETVAGTPPPVGPPPDRRIGAGLLLGLGAVALVAIGILIAYLLTHRHKDHPTTTTVTTAALTTTPGAGQVAVPRFVGLKEAAALVRIGQAGLQPKEVFKTQATSAGVVLSQAPEAAAKVARGSVVTLVIAKPPTATTGSTTTATTTPTTTGVTTTTTATTTPTTTGAATTTTAAPPPPPADATMPDVSAQKEASAVQAMGNVGILASLVFVPGSDPLGTVEQQAKAAGTTVPYHSHVQINLSKGPNASTNEDVPNVVGQTLTQALTALRAAHLRLIYLKLPVTSKAQAGKIVQQSPLAGGQAPQNAQVLVYLGAYRV